MVQGQKSNTFHTLQSQPVKAQKANVRIFWIHHRAMSTHKKVLQLSLSISNNFNPSLISSMELELELVLVQGSAGMEPAANGTLI